MMTLLILSNWIFKKIKKKNKFYIFLRFIILSGNEVNKV